MVETPLKTLKAAVRFFEEKGYTYCLVGGHAASLYRKLERLTRDVDFAVLGDPISESRKLAEQAIRGIGFEPMVGSLPAGPTEKKRRPVSLITSKPEKGRLTGIIDILLPELPWVEMAVKRARYNKINLGFSSVPVITPEDLIVAKCYALRNSPDRFQDLDDIKQIFESVRDLDLPYLRDRLYDLELTIPEPVRRYSPI